MGFGDGWCAHLEEGRQQAVHVLVIKNVEKLVPHLIELHRGRIEQEPHDLCNLRFESGVLRALHGPNHPPQEALVRLLQEVLPAVVAVLRFGKSESMHAF